MTKDILRKDKFGFRRRGTTDATRMLRTMSEQTLDIDKEICSCFTNWQEVFHCVNWTKLMQMCCYRGQKIRLLI
jgi:hypothetical protein